jgi:hypothetical protein
VKARRRGEGHGVRPTDRSPAIHRIGRRRTHPGGQAEAHRPRIREPAPAGPSQDRWSPFVASGVATGPTSPTSSSWAPPSAGNICPDRECGVHPRLEAFIKAQARTLATPQSARAKGRGGRASGIGGSSFSTSRSTSSGNGLTKKPSTRSGAGRWGLRRAVKTATSRQAPDGRQSVGPSTGSAR